MIVKANQTTAQTFTGKSRPVFRLGANRSAQIWDRMAARYAAKPVADLETYERKLMITRQYIDTQSEVLELGCGTGSTAIAHSPYVKHIHATDFSPRMIDIARRKAAAAAADNVDFECCGVETLRYAEKSIDVVLTLNLLHLLQDWQQQISMAFQILRPGGVLISSTICMRDELAFMRLPATVGRVVGLMPLLSFFTRDELEHTMIAAGFEIRQAWQPAPRSAVFIVARKPE